MAVPPAPGLRPVAPLAAPRRGLRLPRRHTTPPPLSVLLTLVLLPLLLAGVTGCDDGGGDDTTHDTAAADSSASDADTAGSDTASDTGADTTDTTEPADTTDTADASDVADGTDAADTADTGDATDTASGDADGADDDTLPVELCAPIPTDLPAVGVERYDRWDVVESFPGAAFGLLDRKVEVFLPLGYDDPANAERRYPVLYMHDGQNLFDAAQSAFGTEWMVDETLDALVSRGAIEPWIVVAMHATNDRIPEYTPDVDPEYGGGEGNAYLDFVTQHVRPWVEDRYRVRCGREHTAIAGSSLGGLISLHAALEHGEVFGRVAAISPSFWWNDRSIVERFATANPELPLRLWLDAGGAEGAVLPTGESTTIANAREVRDRALALGGSFGREVGYLEVPDGEHNEAAWQARLLSILGFLLSDTDYGQQPPGQATLHVYDRWLAPGEASQSALELEFDVVALTWPATGVVFTADEPGVLALDTGDGRLAGLADGAVLVSASALGVTAQQTRFVEVDSDMSDATVRFAVVVPSTGGAVHVSGSPDALGTWDGVGQSLSVQPDGRWAVEVALPLGFFEYKYTRGSWATVEKASDGSEVGNRGHTVEGPVVLEDTVVQWAAP